MSYDAIRHLVDSWGLLATMLLFVALIAWPFLPHAREAHRRAATQILEDEDATHG